MMNKIAVSTTIQADKDKVWDYYTQPEHIVNWNFADPSWYCPKAKNDVRVGGKYLVRMEAKDGDMGFDIEAIYTEVNQGKGFTYKFGNREVTVAFSELDKATRVDMSIDPDNQHSVADQQAGWHTILKNFKDYTKAR